MILVIFAPFVYNITLSKTGKERKREENVMIPQDPVMLLSFINLKLRDFYGSLKQLCDDLDVKEQEITDKLAAIDYHYDEERNQFV